MRFKQPRGVPARKVGEVMVVMTPKTAQLHRLSDVASTIWNTCSGDGATLEEIVEVVVTHYDIDRETAASDVELFLQQASQHGVLEKV